MSKIEEFEQNIIKSGMTDEDFLEYAKLLKRVQGNFSKRQHCYTTAIQFQPKYAEQAVKLIKYGLENFEDGWFSTYTSYLHIGHIYEKNSNYQKAFDYYLLAKKVLGEDHPDYVIELSRDLLWMKLHIDSFSYSAELKEYLLCYEKMNGFSKSFVNSEFILAVANIVVFLHEGKIENAKEQLEIAKEICKPNYVGKLYNILARHKYYESLNTTPESIAFIKKLKI
ncbi:MAG: tetratricopeptide repeat protein [Clostridia bacterium]|nr:tetratricopeptide repeat protein [Clostridia bacterium]